MKRAVHQEDEREVAQEESGRFILYRSRKAQSLSS